MVCTGTDDHSSSFHNTASTRYYISTIAVTGVWKRANRSATTDQTFSIVHAPGSSLPHRWRRSCLYRSIKGNRSYGLRAESP
ncbi:hypothetical protein TNCV_119481 [Trichonephila clavipes]|nr:hypothetical protein TNCV_119481 [Trichonephila clavipes]